MFANVIVRLIKICLHLISLLLNTVPYEYLSKAFSLHSQSWCAVKSSHLPINLLVAISKSNVSFDVDNIILFHQCTTSFKYSPISFLNHFIPLPKQAKITLVSFSHGIALFCSLIFSIHGGSDPFDMFLFVVFLFFCCSCCSGLTNYFLCPLSYFFMCEFVPFRFRYLQENALEVLPDEGFNGLSRLKIL